MLPLLTLDFETYYSDSYNLNNSTSYQEYILSPQFKIHGLAVYYPDGKREFRRDADVLLHELQSVYGNNLENVCIIMHNAMFDAAILKYKFNIIPPCIHDTMLMAKYLYGVDVKVSLKELAERCHLPAKLDLEFSKGKRELTAAEFAELRTYAINDVVITRELYGHIVPKILPEELEIINHTVQCFLRDAVKINKELLQLARHELCTQLINELGEIHPEEVSSDRQFAQLLSGALAETNRDLAMKPGKNGMIPAISKNDPEMQNMLSDPDPLVRELVKARLLVKSKAQLQSRINYLIGTANLTGGTLPVFLKYHHAQTGRFAGGNGLNLQNLPVPGRSPVQILNDTARKIRQAIHAPAGYVFVAVDAAQIEARVLAWLTGEETLNTAFAAGKDIYSEFATDVFHEPAGHPRDSTPAEQRKGLLRKIGKTAILGLGYNMGVKRFAEQLKSFVASSELCRSERALAALANKIVHSYRAKYNNISTFWNRLEKAFRESICKQQHVRIGMLEISSNSEATWLQLASRRELIYRDCEIRPSEFQEITFYNTSGECESRIIEQQSIQYRNSTSLYGGKLTENVVQAIARDLLVRVILECEKAGIPIVLHIHDEVIACVPEVQAEQAMEKMIQIWRTVPQWAEGLVLDAEGVIGTNLAELK